jgi:DNA uptake protein ComE-like DNA-binding protein
LILAVLALTVLVIAAVSLSTTARLEVRAARRGVDEVQREAALRGAVNRGLALLEQGRSDSETLRSTLERYGQLSWAPFAAEADESAPQLEAAVQILDCSSRIDINGANTDQLKKLPGMTDRAVRAITSWRDEESKDKYDGGPRPYEVKRRPYDTVEELLLVRDVDTRAFFGAPTMRETSELPVPPASEWLASLSGENNVDAAGEARVDVNSAGAEELLAAANRVQVAVTPEQLQNLIEKRRQKEAEGTPGWAFKSVSEALREGGVEEKQWGSVLDAWTVDRRSFLPGRINVNTASPAVLRTIPGVSSDLAQQIVRRRAEKPEGLTWTDLLELSAQAGQQTDTAGAGDSTAPQSGGLQPEQMEKLFSLRSSVYLVRCLIREAGSSRVDAVSALIYWPASASEAASIVQWRKPDRFPGWTAWFRPLLENEESAGDR